MSAQIRLNLPWLSMESIFLKKTKNTDTTKCCPEINSVWKAAFPFGNGKNVMNCWKTSSVQLYFENKALQTLVLFFFSP